MEQNKYYTPDISDIRVGYECETRLSGREWLKTIIVERDAIYISSFIQDIKNGNLQTPYLTKEQIEAEGWKDLGEGHTFSKEGTDKLLQYTRTRLRVFTSSNKYIGTFEREYFIGNCPSINELRYIAKLLGI